MKNNAEKVRSKGFEPIMEKTIFMEVRAGFEPANDGFANRSLRPLGHRTEKKMRKGNIGCKVKGVIESFYGRFQYI